MDLTHRFHSKPFYSSLFWRLDSDFRKKQIRKISINFLF
ncbi:hypothetical protein EV03_1214 [Prochlorococcus marinus str. PAC1]|uniref:Uncharacterized protein n=2 Tax=Prochlorococcus marinus TaxID=1219 RepID=A7MDB6_PROMT|nr:Conserved hypothetical protein [Prochlorococcus marinus str. NATL2A]KGG20254.1 hypothetical protein EV03_1214 [Prochlorococcus marinus str. PAC1]